MNKNERDTTMKDSHIVEKEADRDKLQQQFKVLRQDWDSYNQANPRTLRRYSTDSKAMAKAPHPLDSSPRNLISSLQHKWSPSEGGWKMRTNDLAVEEIRRERRSVIESGRLKGRRLFEAVEGENEMCLGGRENICNGWNGLVQAISEVRSVSFYDSDDDHEYESGVSKELPGYFRRYSSSSSSSSPSLCGENVEIQVVEEEKKVLATVETRRVAYGGNGNGRSWMVVMAWFAIASIIYAISIAPMSSFGGYGDEHEMLLVPT